MATFWFGFGAVLDGRRAQIGGSKIGGNRFPAAYCPAVYSSPVEHASRSSKCSEWTRVHAPRIDPDEVQRLNEIDARHRRLAKLHGFSIYATLLPFSIEDPDPL